MNLPAPVGFLSRRGHFPLHRPTAYRLAQAKYDPHIQRAYVELRDEDTDRREVVAVAVFSFHTTSNLTKRQSCLRRATSSARSAIP
jgi:hypothetical protein